MNLRISSHTPTVTTESKGTGQADQIPPPSAHRLPYRMTNDAHPHDCRFWRMRSGRVCMERSGACATVSSHSEAQPQRRKPVDDDKGASGPLAERIWILGERNTGC